MKNLLPKIIILISIIFSLFPFLSTYVVYADDFSFDYDISNSISSDLKLTTEYNITVTNNVGDDFVSKTQIVYPFKPDSFKATTQTESLVSSSTKKDENYIISTDHKPISSKGGKFTFKVVVITSEAVIKKGNIIDASIPGLNIESGVKVNSYSLKISKDLPSLKYISKNSINDDSIKNLDKTEAGFIHYKFSDSLPISLVMGEKSKYNFDISIIPQENTIYFPIISQKQNFTISSISLAPDDTLYDNDNNIVLTYKKTDQPIDIKGSLEVQTDKYKEEDSKLSTSLDNTSWVYDKRLDVILNNVKNQSTTSNKVKTAFTSLSKILKYNDQQKNTKRLSISEILDNPDNLQSLNIADTAITVLRSAGIQTRLIGGFVDSQISNDFSNTGLHYWLEYYDSSFNGWKEADPTLQILSPDDNYYDGIGLTHIELFKSNSGIKIPYTTSYKIQATLESGSIQVSEEVGADLVTKNVQSGKDKIVEIAIKNTGNTLSIINDVDLTIGNDKENTKVNKIIFPNQYINVDTKIKNDNYYTNGNVTVNLNINTRTTNFLNQGILKFEQSNYVLLIVGITSGLIVSILIGVYIFSIKKRRQYKNILKKTISKASKSKTKF